MRNPCAALLVLIALGMEPLSAANYPFQTLINLDGDTASGCAVESGETTLHGSELRAFARTDRSRILEVVLQSCRDAGWHDELRSLEVLPMGLGQGETGSDSADAGSDISHARIAVAGENREFQFDVNNIEDNGLAGNARILFIGNSLTFSNSLPLMLQAIAAQAGKILVAEAITSPGAALEDHFRQRTAHAALANGGYQWVILQQGPSSLPASQDNLRTWAKRYDPLIRAGGARPALYMVWPDVSRNAYFNAVRDAYSNAALAIDGMFIPAGEAWREAWRANSDLSLYAADQFHPSPLGSYAAALSMFAELYQQSPAGLPARLVLKNGVVFDFDEEQVRTIQAAVWRTHLAQGRRGTSTESEPAL